MFITTFTLYVLGGCVPKNLFLLLISELRLIINQCAKIQASLPLQVAFYEFIFYQLIVSEYLQVTQREISSRSITVSGSTYDGETPEYCRFVRSDGLSMYFNKILINYSSLSKRFTKCTMRR